MAGLVQTACRSSFSPNTIVPFPLAFSVLYCLYFDLFVKFYLHQLTWQLSFPPLTYSYFFRQDHSLGRETRRLRLALTVID